MLYLIGVLKIGKLLVKIKQETIKKQCKKLLDTGIFIQVAILYFLCLYIILA